MVINPVNMTALFLTFSTIFSKAYAAATTRSNPNELILDDIAMAIPSAGSATVHAWLGQIKGMREWVGDRVINAINVGTLTVTNRKFENTVSVPVSTLNDDQYGTYTPLIGAMGDSAGDLWIELAVQALTENGAWADGNAFFCSGRLFGTGAGAGTVTNATKTALSKTAVETAIAAMIGNTLDGGKPAKVTPKILLVGPSLAATAKQICEAALIADDGAGVSNVSTATWLQVRVSDELVGANASKWFILGEKAGIKAVAIQKRELPTLTRLDRETDACVFLNDEVLYGTKARGEGFCTLPFLAYMGDPNTDVVVWAEAT